MDHSMHTVRELPHPQLEWHDLCTPREARQWREISARQSLQLTYSGRAAIYQAMRIVRRRAAPGSRRQVVLVPSFHCPTVVDPVLAAGFNIRFYAVDADLRVNQADLLSKLGADVATVIFIRYFGSRHDYNSLFAPVREAGAWVIDDCSHAFLAANPLRIACAGADVTTYSFWKTVPINAGGGFVLNVERMQAEHIKSDNSWWNRERRVGRVLTGQLLAARDAPAPVRLLGRILRAKEQAPEPTPQPAVRKAAAEAYPYVAAESEWAMPWSCRVILQRANLAVTLDSRRRNFEILAQSIEPTPELNPVYRTLAADSCPWGFPVIMRNRPERDYLLRAMGVPLFTFGEVLHPLVFAPGKVDRATLKMARYLSDSLLVLAVHQKLEKTDMSRIAQIVNSFTASL